MITILTITQKYSDSLDRLDLELLLSESIGKSREFILAHPEYELTVIENRKFRKIAERRMNHEPVAYILGHKEFFGLDFKVNRHTLIPRPETELLVEETIGIAKEKNITTIIDVGTGSGNIITSIAVALAKTDRKINYFGLDISSGALRVAKQNAKANHADEKIRFIESDLLSHFMRNKKYKIRNAIMIANLPYLSKEIYSATEPDVKNFEPKSALLSPNNGLAHYEKLLKQAKALAKERSMTTLLEISPEQKQQLAKTVKEILPEARVRFEKDLAGKWRMCIIEIG